MVVLRQVVGDELRRRRMNQGRTLRDVSTSARVSLGYLSRWSAVRRKHPVSCWRRSVARWKSRCRRSCARSVTGLPARATDPQSAQAGRCQAEAGVLQCLTEPGAEHFFSVDPAG